MTPKGKSKQPVSARRSRKAPAPRPPIRKLISSLLREGLTRSAIARRLDALQYPSSEIQAELGMSRGTFWAAKQAATETAGRRPLGEGHLRRFRIPESVHANLAAKGAHDPHAMHAWMVAVIARGLQNLSPADAARLATLPASDRPGRPGPGEPTVIVRLRLSDELLAQLERLASTETHRNRLLNALLAAGIRKRT
jgi:hypothetical protein